MIATCVCDRQVEVKEGKRCQCDYCGMHLYVENGFVYATGGELYNHKIGKVLSDTESEEQETTQCQ